MMGVGVFQYAHLIYEIRDLVASLNIVLTHVLRSQNGRVDKITRMGGRAT